MNHFLVSIVVLIAVLSACVTAPAAPLRIDGSSAEACQASWAKMEASLNAQDRQQLELAMLLIGATKQHRLGTLASGPGIAPEIIREEIDGKDFEEIVAMGKATGTKITGVERPVKN